MIYHNFLFIYLFILFISVTEWGCPILVPKDGRLKPRIVLKDGDKITSEVNANFILTEIHGRDDFSYITTEEDSGCLTEAQNWASMR